MSLQESPCVLLRPMARLRQAFRRFSMMDAKVAAVLDAAYEGALEPQRWPLLLERLVGLFRSHFADSFARTDDYSRFCGIAHGLDRRDYDEQFLGIWVRRNVWGRSHPVRVAGEVVSTRQMVAKEKLLRSEMYNEYLRPRDFDEGLRLSIRAGGGWIQDISLLRSWSAGAFDADELKLAGAILPHLQRAADIARRLAEAGSGAEADLQALDSLRHPVFRVDHDGRMISWNGAADRLLREQDGLTVEVGELQAANSDETDRLRGVVGRARRLGRRPGLSGAMRITRPSGRAALALTALPLGTEMTWSMLRPVAALVIVHDPLLGNPSATLLRSLFPLTEAESALAVNLLEGGSLAQIAARTGRSPHTLRTHLARLMTKTRTSRQSELMQLLLSLPASTVMDATATILAGGGTN